MNLAGPAYELMSGEAILFTWRRVQYHTDIAMEHSRTLISRLISDSYVYLALYSTDF